MPIDGVVAPNCITGAEAGVCKKDVKSLKQRRCFVDRKQTKLKQKMITQKESSELEHHAQHDAKRENENQSKQTKENQSTYKRKDALSGIAAVGTELVKVLLLILGRFTHENKVIHDYQSIQMFTRKFVMKFELT